jgi:hypothetical protein
MTILTSLLACLLLANDAAESATPLPPAGEAGGRVERVLAYKNGLSLVSVRVAGTADDAGRLRFVLPSAQLVAGGVWVEGERAPRSVRAAASEEDVLRPVAGLVELLEANVGREVALRWLPAGVATMPEGGPLSSAGVVQRLLGGPEGAQTFGLPVPSGPTHVVLGPPRERGQWSFGTQVLDLGTIVSVAGEDLRTEIVRPRLREWALEFETEPSTFFECDLHYLARGVSWRAIHRLDGDLLGEDELSLSIELSNELVDLDDTVVHVVAGEPNFQYADLASFLSGVAGSSPEASAWSQQVANPFANNLVRGRAEPASLPDDDAGASASADGDLTRIAVGTLDLAVGGRLLRRVQTQSVPVEHVYTLDLDVRRGSLNGVEVRDARGPRDQWEPAYSGGFVRSRRSKVWHQLALTNTGTTPWTHGPLLVVRRDEDGPFPLAQEALRYTAGGASTEVPLNLALGVEVSFEERSLADGGLVEGVLVVTNRIGEAIALRARVGLGGRVEILDGTASVFESPGRDEDWTGRESSNWRWNRDANPHSEVLWRIELEPGAAATLRYRASFDVRDR